MAAQVAVYTTNYCPYCVRAKQLLSQRGARYDEIRVDDRSDLRTWLIEATGQRTVPQVFINGTPHGGFMELASLDRRGELASLLARAPQEDDPPLRR